jgi:ATP phosphoribosyltransferase
LLFFFECKFLKHGVFNSFVTQLKNVEVWFQRASDVVRKLRSGDVDMGIVGYDMVREYGKDDEDLIVIHDALGYGECHLAVGVPTYGIFESISSISQLAAMPQWTEDRPLRVVTGYTYVCPISPCSQGGSIKGFVLFCQSLVHMLPSC